MRNPLRHQRRDEGVGVEVAHHESRPKGGQEEADQPQSSGRFRLPGVEPDHTSEQERAGEQGEEGLDEEGTARGDLG